LRRRWQDFQYNFQIFAELVTCKHTKTFHRWLCPSFFCSM
jgi:hypothetical protein